VEFATTLGGKRHREANARTLGQALISETLISGYVGIRVITECHGLLRVGAWTLDVRDEAEQCWLMRT